MTISYIPKYILDKICNAVTEHSNAIISRLTYGISDKKRCAATCNINHQHVYEVKNDQIHKKRMTNKKQQLHLRKLLLFNALSQWKTRTIFYSLSSEVVRERVTATVQEDNVQKWQPAEDCVHRKSHVGPEMFLNKITVRLLPAATNLSLGNFLYWWNVVVTCGWP